MAGFITSGVVAVTSPLSVLPLKTDAIAYFLDDVLAWAGIENGGIALGFTITIRLVFSYIFFLEIQRLFPFLVFFFVLPGQMVANCLNTCFQHAKQIR